jgi:drug/metabolite transporter (DMT)-like permease
MGELAALGTALLWAISSTLVGSQTTRVPAPVIAAVQLLAATLMLWSLTAILLTAGVVHGTTLPRGLALASSALIGPGLGDLLYFAGIRLIGVARAFPIAMAASPLFTIALAAVLLGEKITPTVVIGALLIIGGISLIAGRAPSAVPGQPRLSLRNGALLAVAAALLWAVSSVALRAAAEGVAAPVASSIRMPVAALFVLALACRRGAALRPGSYSPRSITTLAAAGLLGPGTGGILYVVAIQRAGAARTAVLSSTAPLFILPLAAVFLGERVTHRMIAGTAVSVAGIWLVAL